MANKIQLRRGTKSNLPKLDIGEPAFCTDTKEFYIGTANGNVRMSYDTSQEVKATDSDKLGGQLPSYYAKQVDVGSLSGLSTSAKSTLVAAINEVFQSGTNVKTNAISAVNGKGASLGSGATWDQIINAIKSIARGQGNAVESQVLKGATFSNSDGKLRTGSMDLKAENIKEGVTYGGITGSLNLESLGGKKLASGTALTTNQGHNISVTSLMFKPSIVILNGYKHKYGSYFAIEAPIATWYSNGWGSNGSKFTVGLGSQISVVGSGFTAFVDVNDISDPTVEQNIEWIAIE